MALSDDNIATIVSSSLSLFASIILIIWEVVQYRRLITTDIERPIALNLSNCIVMLCIADILTCGALAVSVTDDVPHMCFIQAQLTEIGLLSAILWTAAISVYHLYQIRSCALCKDVYSVARGSDTLYLWLCAVCWGIPICAEIIALNFHFYSEQPDPWCWLHDSKYLWVVFLYGWLIAVYIANLVIWVICYNYMKRISPVASYKPTLRLLTGYSVAFWLVWTFPIIRRSYEAWGSGDEEVMNILRFGHAVTIPLQGFFNLIIYGYFRKANSNDEAPYTKLNDDGNTYGW